MIINLFKKQNKTQSKTNSQSVHRRKSKQEPESGLSVRFVDTYMVEELIVRKGSDRANEKEGYRL